MHRNAIRTILALALLAGAARAGDDAETEAHFLRNIRQLTFSGSKSGEAYYSPDGKEIVFQSVRDLENPFYQIYRMNLADGVAHRISTGKGRTTCAYFSPVKKRILFSSSHLDPATDAKQKEELEKLKSGPPPRYKWDFDPFLDIFESDPDGGNLTRLTEATGYDAEGSYSPDGTRIVFCSFRDGDGEIYIMDADGKNQKRLTTEKGYDGGPFFSPDGKKIVWRHFEDEAQKVAEVWTMDIDGANKTQVTHQKAISWAPFWHPSMKWIVFASNFEDPAFELYAVRPDGKDLTRLTYSEGFDGLPVISPDGGSLMWTSNRAESKSQIFVAELHLPGEGPAEMPVPVGVDLGAPFKNHLQSLIEQGAANNFEHEVGRIYLDTGIKPLGKFADVDETSFIQGPSVVGWRAPKGSDDVLIVMAPIESNAGSAFDTAVAIEGSSRAEKIEKGAGTYLSAGYPDELPRVGASARKDLKAENEKLRTLALVSVAGISRVRDRRVFMRGVGTGSGLRELAERLAARHPDVRLILEDDPAGAVELNQKTPVEIPLIGFGGAKDAPPLETADNPEDRAYREQAASLALDGITLLASHAVEIKYTKYDAAAAKAAANASSRPYLGTIPEYRSEGNAGVKLTGVRDGSPAQKSGLQANDVITELGGVAVHNVEDYLKALEPLKIDVETTIKIQRAGKEETIKITPAARH